MANLTGPERARYVRDMFARIADRYDLMNRLMTAGQDLRWRREVIRRAALPPRGRLLDLGAGTGDLAYEALRQHPACQVVAADFTLEMMQVGQARQRRVASAGLSLPRRAPLWAAADALCLPFPSASFDALVSGFLLRNLGDLAQSLSEQIRLLKPGGRWVALDTTHPSRNLLSPLIDLHLHAVIPALGRVLTGEGQAYAYLPDSTEGFLGAEALAARLLQTGFHQVGFRRLMFGTVAIHWAIK
jgi:demethylmenaquinone methyltransferase/2-methoxy-6-polyprenyl-1,4-benzoquinol methylase